MRTTTVVRTSLELTYPLLDEENLAIAANNYWTKANSVFETFKTTHGITSDNLVSQTEGAQRVIVRSWPDLETAQAWVDVVLAGDMSEGLDHYAVIVSAQVDPE
jgi:hypothetical protein